MAIKKEYRLYFDSEDGSKETSLELSANVPEDELAVWMSTAPNGHGEYDLFVRMTRDEALELKAVLGVLTDTANSEEQEIVGGAS